MSASLRKCAVDEIIRCRAPPIRLTIMALFLGLTILVTMRIVDKAIPGSGKSN